MSDQPASLAAALLQLQASLPKIVKTAQGQHGKYADLHVITEAIKPLLTELGLLWICLPTLMEDRFVLDYYMHHVASDEKGLQGQYPLDSATPQGRGGEITYARRYALCAALDIAPAGTDDDGQLAEDEAREWRAPANPRTRKADRYNAKRNGPLPDDDWTTGPPEDAPGSISQGRLTELHVWFTKRGITDREDRLAYTMSALDLPELGSSKDLSESQALALIKHLKEDSR